MLENTHERMANIVSLLGGYVREVSMVRLCHKESAGFLQSVRDVTGLGIGHVRAWRRERPSMLGEE